MFRIYILVLIFIVPYPGLGQISSYSTNRSSGGNVHYSFSPKFLNKLLEFSFNGTALLASNQQISSKMTYNPLGAGGLLQIHFENRMMSLTPKQVQRFYFYDSAERRNRDFHSITMDGDHYYFAEILLEDDKLSLLGIEGIRIHQDHSDGIVSSFTRAEFSLLLFNSETGNLMDFNRRSLYDLMKEHKKEVKRYKKLHELQFREPRDAIQLVKFCNSILE